MQYFIYNTEYTPQDNNLLNKYNKRYDTIVHRTPLYHLSQHDGLVR